MDFPVLASHFQKTGLATPTEIPLLYAGAMAVNGLTALVFGRLFDRFGIMVLVAGIFISVLSLPLGFLGGPTAVIAAVGCWATGLGAQDASLRSGIAQVVSMNKRGTGFRSVQRSLGCHVVSRQPGDGIDVQALADRQSWRLESRRNWSRRRCFSGCAES